MSVAYKIVIDSFAQTVKQSITIANNSPSDLYFFTNFKINYNIFDPKKNTASVTIESRGYNLNSLNGTINPINDFATGNIVSYYVNETLVYIGYIVSLNVSKNIGPGTTINLQINSLLMSLGNQVVVNSVEDNVVLGTNTYITNFASNNIVFQYILEWFTNKSIISYAAQNILNNAFSVSDILGLPYVFRNGSENYLDETSKVWFYASSNTNRLDCLKQILQPYQRLLYQDPSGLIRIEPATSEMYQIQGDGFSFNFDLTSNALVTPGNLFISNTCPWMSYSYKNNAAALANRAYSMLYPVGINLSENGPGSSAVVSTTTSATANNLFPRSTELLNSGQFEQSISYGCDLSSNMISDPQLLTYYSVNTTAGLVASLAGNSAPGSGQVSKIYSQIALARELFNESQLQIDIPYESVANYPLPLGRSISVNAPFMLDTNTWYCYGCIIDFSNTKGSTLRLMLCKPYTYFGYWTSEIST